MNHKVSDRSREQKRFPRIFSLLTYQFISIYEVNCNSLSLQHVGPLSIFMQGTIEQIIHIVREARTEAGRSTPIILRSAVCIFIKEGGECRVWQYLCSTHPPPQVITPLSDILRNERSMSNATIEGAEDSSEIISKEIYGVFLCF